MSSMFRSVYAVLAGILVLGASVAVAENAASEASEQAPPPNIQGTTAAKGPHKMFQKDEKAGDEQKKEEKSEAKKAEKSDDKAEARAAKKSEEKADKSDDKAEARAVKKFEEEVAAAKRDREEKKGTTVNVSSPGGVALRAETAKEPAAKPEEETKKPAEVEASVRGAIGRLSTSGWREAQAEIVAGGKIAVPLLIDAMSTEGETAPHAAYNLGGHTKADTGRATRQRTLGEVCAELLNDIVANHSNYKGELPAPEQKAWQEWWAANGAGVTFAK